MPSIDKAIYHRHLGICFAEARRNGAHLPVAALIERFYSQVQKMGGRR